MNEKASEIREVAPLWEETYNQSAYGCFFSVKRARKRRIEGQTPVREQSTRNRMIYLKKFGDTEQKAIL